ncbi:MAG TPA: hypothetical protein VGH77_05480 [Streptosporangiaceae bacterium]
MTNWVTIALNNRELRRTAAHLIILPEGQNRTDHRLINIALQARGHWFEPSCATRQNAARVTLESRVDHQVDQAGH